MIGFDGVIRISGVTLCMVADAPGCAKSPATAASSPREQAALKVFYLAVRNLDDYRGPSVGTRSFELKQAVQGFTIYFDGRIPIRRLPRSLTQSVGHFHRALGQPVGVAPVL
jgi:hypothetical protein